MNVIQRLRFLHCPMSVQIFEPSVFIRPEGISIGDKSRIDSFVKIEGGRPSSKMTKSSFVSIGQGVHISSFCHLNIGGGNLIIDNWATLASGVRIITRSNVYGYGAIVSTAAPEEFQHVIDDAVIIGQNVFIQTGVIIIPGVTIGHGAVIKAGSVVTKNVPAFDIWAGEPAKKVAEVQGLSTNLYPNRHEITDLRVELAKTEKRNG